MNALKKTKLIEQNRLSLHSIALDYGEPSHYSDEELGRFLGEFAQNPLLQNRFALVINIKKREIVYSFNIEKHLTTSPKWTLEKWYHALHDAYIEPYFSWLNTFFQHAATHKEKLKPMQQTYRLTVPIKLTNGHFFWVNTEGYPLQLDSANNMISYLLIGSILSPFDAKNKPALLGYVWENNNMEEIWSQLKGIKYTKQKPFHLPDSLKQIVQYVRNNPTDSHKIIAQHLGKMKNTIDVQHKDILYRARESFKPHAFSTVKEVVVFLERIGYFEDG